MERVLDGGMRLMNAKGAAAVLMDVHTGEVVAISSLPDFDPNERPAAPVSGSPGDSPLFNRAVQGVYELGSTFKIFAVSQALDLGLVSPQSVIDTSPPFKVAGFRIGEFNGKNYGKLSVEQIIVHSSNRGTGKIALALGPKRQQEFLDSLGFLKPTPLEIVEAAGRPAAPAPEVDRSEHGHDLLRSRHQHLAAAPRGRLCDDCERRTGGRADAAQAEAAAARAAGHFARPPPPPPVRCCARW